MRPATLLLAFFLGLALLAQPRILHFTATSGFDHGTREISFALFRSIATEIDVTVADAFGDPGSLSAIRCDPPPQHLRQRDPRRRPTGQFRELVRQRRPCAGDPCGQWHLPAQHRNGSSTGVRDYYAEPIGASVQENPNPVIGAPATSTTVPNKRVIPAVGVFMHGDAGGASSSFLQLQSMSAMMASNAMMACAQRGVPIASIRLS